MTRQSYKPTGLDQILELPWYFAAYWVIKTYGWIYGIANFVIVQQVYIKLMKQVFGLEYLSGMDVLWLQDDETNNANIVTYLKFEKWKDPEEAKRLMLKRALGW